MRSALVLILSLLGFLGWAVGCGERDLTQEEPVVGPEDPAPEDADPAGPAEPEAPFDPLGTEDTDVPVFQSAKECGTCHVEIYNEWKQSYHGRAMSDPLFLEFTAEINKEECIRCHAPVALREAGFTTPIARTERREDAVSCLTCHQAGGRMAGPHKGLTGACRPIYDPAQTDVSKMCFACHNQHGTGNEWLRGPYSPQASIPRSHAEKNCLDCHMEKVYRPLVQGGPKRWGRKHTWPGGHSVPQLKKAAQLEIEVTPLDDGGFRFRVWVENVGAGHAIPTDARHRSFDTYVKVVEEGGQVLLDPLDPRQQSRAHVGNYRLQYRNSGKKDTQIPPGERVSALGTFPGAVEVPQARKGVVEAWLVYRLTPRDVLDERSLAQDGNTDLANTQIAPRVLKVEVPYGE